MVDGMFAFALIDKEKEKLFLCRDLFGEKPLYIYNNGKTIAFASELKAIEKLPGFCKELNRRAVGYMIKKGYIPSPLSIYKSVKKVRPACLCYRRFSAGHIF